MVVMVWWYGMVVMSKYIHVHVTTGLSGMNWCSSFSSKDPAYVKFPRNRIN